MTDTTTETVRYPTRVTLELEIPEGETVWTFTTRADGRIVAVSAPLPLPPVAYS